MKEALNSYFTYIDIEKNFSAHTISAYGKDLSQWENFLIQEQLDWSDVEVNDLFSFLSVINSGLTRRSQARKLSAIRSFYRFAEKRGFIRKNPFRHLRFPRYSKGLPTVLPPVDSEVLLDDDSGQNGWIQLRDRALFEFLYSSGARISEALALDESDILSSGEGINGEVVIFGKGRKERVIFIGTKAKTVLLTYLSQKKNFFAEQPALFVNARGGRLTRRGALYILQQRSRHLGLEGEVSPHSLRHTFATDLLNEGADIRHVQEMLGHASVSTTQNYTHVAKDRLKKVYRESHPHSRGE